MRTLLPFLLFAFTLQGAFGQSVTFVQELQGERLPIGYFLSWKTQAETPGLIFALERSKDGMAFELFHEEQAKGGAVGASYQLLIPDSQTGQWMYRLRTIAAGKTVSASSILREDHFANDYNIHGLVKADIRDKLEIQIESRTPGDLLYTLLSKDRRVLKRGQWLLIGGLQTYQLDIADIEKGLYTLVLANGTEIEEVHFRKVEPVTAALTTLSLE